MTNVNRKAIAACIQNHLDNHHWHYEYDEDNSAFFFSVALGGKVRNLRYVIRVDETEFTVYGLSPLDADSNNPEEMGQIALFLHEANYAVTNGCFELDPRDGEIRSRCYVDCEGGLPSDEVIRNSIFRPALFFGYFFEGIVKILWNGASWREAFESSLDHLDVFKDMIEAMIDASDFGTNENSGSSENDDTEQSLYKAVNPFAQEMN